jgi:Na+/H+ antiporter NhaC
MQNNFKRQKLILFSILLLLLFTYPLVSIANKEIFVAGIPLLFVYIFIVWIIAIIILYRLADHNSKKPNE